jgi:hypothetical protein
MAADASPDPLSPSFADGDVRPCGQRGPRLRGTNYSSDRRIGDTKTLTRPPGTLYCENGGIFIAGGERSS